MDPQDRQRSPQFSMGNMLVTMMVMFLFLAVASNFGTQNVTIAGKVQNGKIVAENGDEYLVADSPTGVDMLKNYAGHQVEVTGKMRELRGQKVLLVASVKDVSSLAEGYKGKTS